MDVYSTSFSFPNFSFPSSDYHRDPYSFLQYPPLPPPNAALDQQIVGDIPQDAVHKLVAQAIATHSCVVTYSRSERGKGWNFYLSGTYQQVMAARGMIIREAPITTRIAVKVARSELLNAPSSSPSLKPEIRRRLDEIAAQLHVHISVVNTASTPQSVLRQTNGFSTNGSSMHGSFLGLETERVCELVIFGTPDTVDVARVRLLVMLDEMSGLHAEAVEIDHKLHPIIAGRKRQVIQGIQEETATNIYLPAPLQCLAGPPCPPLESPSGSGTTRLHSNIIWITGEFFNVQRARDTLVQLSLQKAKAVISREAPLVPRKLDWMITERLDDLKTYMRDNGTYINCPPVGSQTSLITVFGENRIHIQRTLRSIMQLACGFYSASFWLLPIHYNVLMPTTINPQHMPVILKRVSMTSGSEIVFKGNCFEMHGLDTQVRAAASMVLELDIIKDFNHEMRFQTELANEHRDFISGKKNGKINKIMQITNVKIKFETFNDFNFLIDLSGTDSAALAGLTMLQEELPAEISFHVPEAYHKRIIGVGGRSIQRIMKKYGVYVKFSNAEEFAALGGYADNEDNVVARTPAKNAINLENLKQSVLELVNPKDKDFIHETVSIPRKYHRTLIGEKSIFIHDIENKTNSRICFPDKEAASDIVDIYGPENQVHIATAMLLDHVLFEADMPVPPTPELGRLVPTQEFKAFIEQVKAELEVDIIAPTESMIPTSGAGSNGTSNGVGSSMIGAEPLFFRMHCQRSNSDSVATAREMLEGFLLKNNVQVYSHVTSTGHRRSDSFADAFPHFNSKLLATTTAGGGGGVPDSPDYVRNVDLAGSPDQRRVRLATSSPDVKALFHHHSPSYVYKLPEHEEQDEMRGYGGEYWPSLGPPPLRTGGIPVHRSRHREDPVKRGSDSLLDAKIKEQLTKPRSLTNRAQSLDLTLSLSRISEQASRLPPPPSPTGSTATSSPTSVTAPLFPSVYAPPNSASLGGAGNFGGGVPGVMGSINVGGSAVSTPGSGGGGSTGVIGSHRQQSSLSSLQISTLPPQSSITSAPSVASSISAAAAAAAVTAAAVASTQNQTAADEVARVISNLRL
ncbi:hypothetical protein Clacol_003045 [Clathrus columnatus]|uniref:K Homology domain-containing protein n=1 Tax=Clathrus columnatus TaxID=1419009 RepID=A0AAV5A8D8_9AGAM|nr:hypothetical protein Clacol_003045 [Clathrus columnatus]